MLAQLANFREALGYGKSEKLFDRQGYHPVRRLTALTPE